MQLCAAFDKVSTVPQRAIVHLPQINPCLQPGTQSAALTLYLVRF